LLDEPHESHRTPAECTQAAEDEERYWSAQYSMWSGDIVTARLGKLRWNGWMFAFHLNQMQA